MNKELVIMENLFAGKRLYICGNCAYFKSGASINIAGITIVQDMINRDILRCVPVEIKDGKISKWEVVLV